MEQDVIGKWNEEKNRIDFDETGEESEEEYDEEAPAEDEESKEAPKEKQSAQS